MVKSRPYCAPNCVPKGCLRVRYTTDSASVVLFLFAGNKTTFCRSLCVYRPV